MKQIQLQRIEKLRNNKYILILSSHFKSIETNVSELEARKIIQHFNLLAVKYKDKTIYE